MRYTKAVIVFVLVGMLFVFAGTIVVTHKALSVVTELGLRNVINRIWEGPGNE